MFTIKTDYPKILDECYFEFTEDFINKTKDGWDDGDFFKNHKFNELAYSLFNHSPLFIADLGCGGGGFVDDCIKDGHNCIGIDAHPLFKERGLRSWSLHPDNMFQTDLGKPYQIFYNNEPVKFDLITSWECFEHINTEDILNLVLNIKKHIKIGGYVIFSASTTPESVHRTRASKEWWLSQFLPHGFVNTNLDFYPHLIRNCPGSSFSYLKYEGN